MNVGFAARAWARNEPDREAVIDLRSEVRLSFGAMHARASSLAAWLYSIGFGRGEWAVFLSKNRYEFFEIFLAVAQRRGALYPVNWRLSGTQIGGILSEVRPRVIFCDEQNIDRAHALAAEAVPNASIVILDQPGRRASYGAGATAPAIYRAYSAIIESDLPDAPIEGGTSDDPVFAVHTGGTTGSVKGAIHSHAGLLAAFLNNGAVEGIQKDDRYLITGQLFHSAAILALNYIVRGAAVVIFDYSHEAVLAVSQSENVTATLVFPTMVRGVLDLPGGDKAFSAMRSIQYGGGGFNIQDVKRLYESTSGGLLHCYGTSESVGVTFLTPSEHDQAMDSGDFELLNSCGREASLTEVAILDDNSEEVPWDGVSTGEIFVRSASNLLRYVGSQEEFGPMSWVPTGDLAYRRMDGRLVIAGRAKLVIRCGGENIYPRQLEQCISSVPGVFDVAVVGATDRTWGEVPVAYVVLQDQGPSVTEISIVQSVVERLGSYQKPKAVRFVSELPLSATGKVERGKLSRRYESEGSGT